MFNGDLPHRSVSQTDHAVKVNINVKAEVNVQVEVKVNAQVNVKVKVNKGQRKSTSKG